MISKVVFHFFHLKTIFLICLVGSSGTPGFVDYIWEFWWFPRCSESTAIAGHGMAYSQQVLAAGRDAHKGRDPSCVSLLPGPGSQELLKQVQSTL